jgi:hypothetical protein
MAELCVTYLTFHCFDPTISDLEIQEHTKAGDYSFQEYATCNWIRHVESAIDFLTENVNEEKEVFKISYNSLRKLHVLHSSLDESTQEIVSLVEQRAQLKSDLLEFRKSYSTDSILTKISNNGEFRRIEVRLKTDMLQHPFLTYCCRLAELELLLSNSQSYLSLKIESFSSALTGLLFTSAQF